MAQVSISEAARLTGKSRTTLHRLIKTGELSTCRGERNAKLLDTAELLRVFDRLHIEQTEQVALQVSEQRVTAKVDDSEQAVQQLQQEVEHLKTLVSAQSSHIESLKHAMLLLEHKQDVPTRADSAYWWQFWK